MGKIVMIKLSRYACPACDRYFPTDNAVHLPARSGSVTYVCGNCSARISIRVSRRGQVRFESDASEPFVMPDGSLPPPKLVSKARADDPRPEIFFALDKYEVSLHKGGSRGLESRVKSRVVLPILWTPDSGGSRLVRLTDLGETEAAITCCCPTCRSRLTNLTWSAKGEEASPDPPFGVVVVDTYLKPLMRPITTLGQRLREQHRAAALLVCRRCETQTGFVFREPRSLRRVPLDRLLLA